MCKRILIAVVAVLVDCYPAFAATIHVPADQPTIQAGIDAASESDTVLVAPGTYTGDGNHEITFEGKNILLKSEQGAEQTVIDCIEECPILPFDPPCPEVRAFVFSHGESPQAVVDGFTITGAKPRRQFIYEAGGSAIHCTNNSNPTIRNCVITGNAGVSGGGIHCVGSSPRIEFNRIIGNRADMCAGLAGGGVYCSNSDAYIADNEISANFARDGGGIAVFGGSPTIVRNLLANDSAVHGAAIYCSDHCSPAIRDNTLAGNHVLYQTGCLVFSPGSSGAAQPVSDTALWNQSIIMVNNADVFVNNCIIATNVGVAVYCDSAGSVTLSGCAVYGNTFGNWAWCAKEQEGARGNLSLDPLFCDAVNGDYHLSAYSPCAPANNYWDGSLIGALGPTCNELVCGDADMDGHATPADVALLRAYYFSTDPTPYIPVGAADMDCNDRLSINDLIWLAGYVYGFGPAPCCDPQPPKWLETRELDGAGDSPTE